MRRRKNVLAICGSTRERSTNLNFIKAITELAADRMDIHVYTGLSDLPHFNPDLDTEAPPAAVTAFREQLKAADGVLICTPEYAMGLPGTLKNALDWTVSSSGFSNKPVAAITASTSGQKAHESLLGTLTVIEARVDEPMQLLVSFAATKLDKENHITDPWLSHKVEQLIVALAGMMDESVGG
jgi:NAD(P)H-dependent FMN reductase